MKYAGDFETIGQEGDCRIWAWAVCQVGNTSNFRYGNDMDGFFSFCEGEKHNPTIFFHNLKFDGEFIIAHLFRSGYRWVKGRKELEPGTFTTLISDGGVFYQIQVCFGMEGKRLRYALFQDSLKLFPMTVARLAQAFSLPIQKLSIDYKEIRPIGHELTTEEVAYIKNDVTIVALALERLDEMGLTKMTIGSNALADYKRMVGKKFRDIFPIPDYDVDVRKSYKGGFTYVNDIFKEVDVGEGIVLDVNSLYPSVMRYEKMPYGEGVRFEGEYKEDNVYDLYIQQMGCYFELKPGHLPTIQLKNNRAFMPNEYVKSSKDEDGSEHFILLTLTSVDLELFREHYEIIDPQYYGGWKFKSTVGLFTDYIDKWNGVKVTATKEGNRPMREIAKLMLNNLYGKFSTNPTVYSKEPYMGEDGVVHYRVSDPESREPVYIPAGTFITAWARNKTIRSAQKVYNRFIYADTDSLHLVGTEVPEGLEISDTKLGAWKIEKTFRRARFLRQKSYIEEVESDGEWTLSVTCAGMPDACHPYVTWENFRTGAQIPGKLKSKRTAGGVILAECLHTLRE